LKAMIFIKNAMGPYDKIVSDKVEKLRSTGVGISIHLSREGKIRLDGTDIINEQPLYKH